MSRLWRYGTCYSRIRDFVRAGFISDEAKPIWFDVWTNHPPFTNPVLGEKEPLNEFIFRPQVVNAPKRKNFVRLFSLAQVYYIIYISVDLKIESSFRH